MGPTAQERMHAAGVQVGDRLRLLGRAEPVEGVLMPHPAFSAPDVAIVKLSSGYNIGVRVTPEVRIELVQKAQPRTPPARTVPSVPGKPSIRLLGTGGTIASYVDYRTGAVHPAGTAEELAFATPEIFEFANVRAEVVYQLFSEDLAPRNWLELARRVKAAFDEGARGVVIPHGTDTLGFTAAGLAFLLRDLPGPVVLVGSQRSSDRPSSDAATNLIAACRVAATADLAEVVVCMHATTSDRRIAVHRGVRVRKNHSSRRDAFESVNARPLGYVEGDEVRLLEPHRPRSAGPTRLYPKIAEDVALLVSYPGLEGEQVEAFVRGRGAVLAGTGLGHFPRTTFEALRRLHDRGVHLVMTTQCLGGRTDLDVYSTGRDLQRAGVVPGHDMLPETAYAKLCWALANAPNDEDVRAWMATDQVGEMSERTEFEVDDAPR